MSDNETTATARDLDPAPAGASPTETAPAAPIVAENAAADTPPIGQRIRAARETRGMTMAELGARAGTSKYTISKIELGKITDSSFLPPILEILGLSPDLIVEDARRRACLSIAAHAGRAAAGRESAASRSETSARLASDFEAFAAERLIVRSKSGAMLPLVFNRAQRHVHAQLEAQKAATGKVRALILKGRQQGCSTYVGGRFYHRASRSAGLRVFILTHAEQATKNLFEMVERFHDFCPQRPSTRVANARELLFDGLGSGYKVGTAGTRGVGRSATVQLLHGSEVAFWPHAQTHAAGALQTVPDAGGTEVILESTANGAGNLFHQMWRDAETGVSEYIAVFVPWYWQEEYRKPAAGDFMLSEEEHGYAALYGLDAEQMAWRRAKIVELKDASLFRQEYPASAAEAFQMSGHDSFIPPALIAKARKACCEPSGPLIIGYDPAWTGGDRHSMAWRRGRRLIKVESRTGLDTVAAAGWVRMVIDADRPAKLFLDVGGVGAGVYDQLQHMGLPYSSTVEAVNFGSSPVEPAPLDEQGRPYGGPLNRRAEMWLKSKQWLEGEAPVQIPDSDALQADACGPGYRYDALTRLVLEAKEDMRRRGAKSPDEWDAVALTFARPVRPSNFNRKLIYPPSGLGNGV
ncbi:MAG: helix-turn-helix domain-containing protein [Xanthobacteraceae bacterium]